MDESVIRGPQAGLAHRWTGGFKHGRAGTAHAQGGQGTAWTKAQEQSVPGGPRDRGAGSGARSRCLHHHTRQSVNQAEQSFPDNGCVQSRS